MNPEVKHEEAKPHKQESAAPEGTERTYARKVYVPQVDILETEQALLLVAEMPGVDEGGVDITVEKNILTIRGRVEASIPAGFRPAYSEYQVGDYERVFSLSDEVDKDRIKATIRNGVLKLVLPKAEAVKARKIAVTTA